MVSQKQLEANRKNAQKSTGPKTEEGKAIASMNALKHGMYLKKFYKLGSHAGKLKICQMCTEEQRIECSNVNACLLADHITLAYIKAHQTNDVKHIEELNLHQIAIIDAIFNFKLRYAMENLFEFDEYEDEQGRIIRKERVDTQYIYMLINMFKALNKSLDDMQLTRAKKDTIDVEWAKLAEAEMDPEKANAFKEKILNQMEEFAKARKEAEKNRNADEAIRKFLKSGDIEDADFRDIDLNNMRNPFE